IAGARCALVDGPPRGGVKPRRARPITGAMSLELAIARVQEIQSALAVVAGGPPPVGVVNVNGGAAAPPAAGPPAVAAGAGSFSHLLQQTLAGPGQVGFPTAMGVPGALPVAAVHGGAA